MRSGSITRSRSRAASSSSYLQMTSLRARRARRAAWINHPFVLTRLPHLVRREAATRDPATFGRALRPLAAETLACTAGTTYVASP